MAFKTEEKRCHKCNKKGHLSYDCKKVNGTRKGNNTKNATSATKKVTYQKNVKVIMKNFVKYVKRITIQSRIAFSDRKEMAQEKNVARLFF